MKRIAAALALLTLTVAPALADHDWDDDDDGYYETYRHRHEHWRGDHRAYYGAPVPAYEVYIPYGTYFADEPNVYGPGCEVEREWKHGHYKEKIECDDD